MSSSRTGRTAARGGARHVVLGMLAAIGIVWSAWMLLGAGPNRASDTDAAEMLDFRCAACSAEFQLPAKQVQAVLSRGGGPRMPGDGLSCPKCGGAAVRVVADGEK